MGRSLIWIALATVVLVALLSFAGNGYYQRRAARAEFYRKLDSLMQQGSKLSAMTTQGVNISEFRSQLASVHAEYDLLGARWEEQKWPLGYGAFGLAVTDWDLALTFWKMDLKRPAGHHISTDPKLLSYYTSMDPKLRALDSTEDSAGVNLTLAVRAFMGDASDHFEESKNLIERYR